MSIPVHPIRFRIPALPEFHLSRPRLLTEMASGCRPECKLTLVFAGPGTGKTALLAEYAAQCDGPVAWLTLAPSHQDPTFFCRDLFAACRLAFADLSRLPDEALASLGRGGAETAIGLFCDELATVPQMAMVVIDDMHRLEKGHDVVTTLERLVAYFPEEVQLVFSGRTVPEVPLSQYDLNGLLQVIDTAMLNFTQEELRNLLEIRGGSTLAKAIWERTKGWITGIRYGLAQPQTLEAAFEAPDRLDAFLREEVLERFPAELQPHLVASSFLTELTPEACHKALGDDSAVFLKELRRHASLHMTSGGELALHPLVRDFLQREPSTGPPDRPAYREFFTRFAELAIDPEEAVLWLQRARDWPAAIAKCLDCAPGLFRAGRTGTLYRLLEAFPAEYRAKSVTLLYLHGEILRVGGDLAKSLEVFSRALAIAREGADRELLGCVLSRMAGVYATKGELARQLELAQAALAELPESCLEPRAFAYNVIGIYHLYRLENDTAQTHFRKALAIYQEIADCGGQVRVLHNLAQVQANRGEFRKAQRFYGESIRRAEIGGLQPLPLTHNNLALSHFYLGEWDEAFEVVERGMALSVRLDNRRDSRYLLVTIGRLSLRRGEFAKAEETLDLALADATSVGDKRSEVSAILGLAELALLRGEVAEAQERLEQALVVGGAKLADPEFIDGALLQVAVYLETGAYDAALQVLELVEESGNLETSPYLRFHTLGLKRKRAVASGVIEGLKAIDDSLSDLKRRFGFASLDLPSPATIAQTEAGTRFATAASPHGLDIFCLGQFEAFVQEEPALEWKSHQAKIVLAYLVLHPQGATKEQLSEMLYPEGDPGRSTIPTLITRLRRTLEPDVERGTNSRFILYQGGRYIYNRGVRTRVDTLEFQEWLRRAEQSGSSNADREKTLESAVACYRGSFLSDFGSITWCRLEAEYLRRRLGGAFDALYRLAAQADQWVRLEALAARHLSLDGLEQTAYRARLIALAMQDREADAKRFADLTLEVLGGPAGSGPEESTLELIEGIRERTLTIRAVLAHLAGST